MKLFYLSLISCVFMISVVLVFAKKVPAPAVTVKAQKTDFIEKSDLPVLKTQVNFPILSAQGVIAQDLDSAVFLYEKDADAKLLPASTTKIMTSLVVLDFWNPEEILEMGKISVEGQKMGLVKGEKIKVRALLDGLLIYSANDAAEAFAQNYPGGRVGFVMAMNEKAKDLHLTNTSFLNPTGLDEAGHVSTAKDMVRLSQIAMQNLLFAEIVGTKEKIVKSEDNKFVHYLTNINSLLGKVEGVKGVKTGWTQGARENLVTFVERGRRKILIALLGSQDRFGETKELIDWVYRSYEWQNTSSLGSRLKLLLGHKQ